MPTRTAITRTRRDQQSSEKEFVTSDMIPTMGDSGVASAVQAYRITAWEAYQQLPLPTTGDEPWRRTDLRLMKAGNFRKYRPDNHPGNLFPVPDSLLHPVADQEHGGQVILTPADVRVYLSNDLARMGVILTDLLTAEKEHPEMLEKILGKIVRPDEGKFAAMAGALADRGVLLYVPRGVQVEQPLHSLFWVPGIDLAHFSHILVYIDDGASATNIHENASHARCRRARRRSRRRKFRCLG